MRLLLCCPVSVWTDLFQRWWARKKHHSGWTEFPPHFRVLCTILYEKVQGKRSSRNLAMTEIKKKTTLHPVYLQFGPALSFPSLPVQLREKEPLRKKGFCPAPSQGKSTQPQTSLHWLPFHRGFYSWKLLAQVSPLHLPCGEKNPEVLPTTFLWIGWLKWCLRAMAE